MSHFTTCQTRFTSRETLTECLKQLGFKIIEATKVAGYRGRTTQVDFAIETAKGGYRIGFKKTSEGTYEIVADWFGVRGITRKELEQKLNVAYSEVETRTFAKKYKFQVSEGKVEAGKRLILVRRSY